MTAEWKRGGPRARFTGPALNGVRARHDRVWVLGQFSDPEKFTPGSGMPPVDDLGPDELGALTDYVMAIPK